MQVKSSVVWEKIKVSPFWKASLKLAEELADKMEPALRSGEGISKVVPEELVSFRDNYGKGESCSTSLGSAVHLLRKHWKFAELFDTWWQEANPPPKFDLCKKMS